MQYFVTGTDGVEYGPVDLASLQSWVKDNRVFPNTKVRNATNGMVLQASTMPEVSNLFPPAPMPSIGTVAPMAGYEGRPSYAQPDMTAQMMRNYNDEGWKPFMIVIGLCAASIIVSATVGYYGTALGIWGIRQGWEAKESDQNGGLLAFIISIISLILAIGLRFALIANRSSQFAP